MNDRKMTTREAEIADLNYKGGKRIGYDDGYQMGFQDGRRERIDHMFAGAVLVAIFAGVAGLAIGTSL